VQTNLVDYQTILDSLADAIVVADLGDRIVYINPAAERLLGWTRAEVVGQALTMLMPARMHALHLKGFQRFVETRNAHIMGRPVRVPAVRKDGREIDIELILSSLLPSPTGDQLIVATMRDLSDRVELERQLHVTRYLKAAAASTAALTAQLDVDHVVKAAATSLVAGFDAALGRVWLHDSSRNALILRASAGLSEQIEGSTRSTIDIASYPYKVARVARTLSAFVKNDLTGDLEFEQAWVERERLKAVAVLPLVVGGELRGVLASFFRMPLYPEVTEALVTFAALTASAINGSLLHQAEKATRQRFEDFVNGIHHGIVWEAEATTLRITFVSAKAEQLLGYPLADWYREPSFWMDRVHPEDRERFYSTLREGVDRKENVDIEHRFVKADGGFIWLHTGARLAETGPGAGVMIHALSADVTQIKIAEAKAAATARQLDTILRGVSEGITAHTADGQLVYANKAATRLSGASSVGELLSTPLAERPDRFEVLDEDGRSFPRDRLPVRLALTGKMPEDVVVRVRDLTTSDARWVVLSATPILNAEGRVEMVINVFRDVTAAKHVELGLRLLSEGSAVLGSSLDYRETLRSLAQLAVPRVADWCSIHLQFPGSEAPELFVVAHPDPAKVESAHELSAKPPSDPSATRAILQAMRTGRPELHEEISDDFLLASARDEDHHHILRALGMKSLMVVPLTARGFSFGAMSFVAAESGRRFTEADLVLAQSLAERAAYAVENSRLYAESIRARTQAEEASRLKDEFLTTVSHELRTPLSAILGWAAMLNSDRPRDPSFVQKGVEVIERNARSQLRIIDDILDVSRIVRGQLRIETEPVDLQLVATEALESVKPAADAKRIKINFIECDGPCRVMADPDRLRQILWNLLSNAVKFTPHGGAVDLAVRQVSGSLEVEVHDTGRGIDPAFAPYVFDRFRQADGSISRSAGGLGLGLAIVRHLVEMHGGTVKVFSAGLGLGSTFTVTLPVKPFTTPIRTGEHELDRDLEDTAPSRRGSLSGMRLLVVEDEPDSRELIELLLESEGAEVETAASADDALQVAETSKVDVLVSDISMAVHDGYWLVGQIRERLPTLPAVALTAHSRHEDVARARTAGFDVHVAKPVDPERLLQTIAALRPS
jgi:PAS domain S-box-containing protein